MNATLAHGLRTRHPGTMSTAIGRQRRHLSETLRADFPFRDVAGPTTPRRSVVRVLHRQPTMLVTVGRGDETVLQPLPWPRWLWTDCLRLTDHQALESSSRYPRIDPLVPKTRILRFANTSVPNTGTYPHVSTWFTGSSRRLCGSLSQGAFDGLRTAATAPLFRECGC